MMTKIVHCKCGEPYHVYSHYAGDQSVCPDCRIRAETRIRENEQKRTTAKPFPR